MPSVLSNWALFVDGQAAAGTDMEFMVAPGDAAAEETSDKYRKGQ